MSAVPQCLISCVKCDHDMHCRILEFPCVSYTRGISGRWGQAGANTLGHSLLNTRLPVLLALHTDANNGEVLV
jgi:hypothetical protein